MPSPRPAQAELFAPAPPDAPPIGDLAAQAGVPDSFIADVRAELNATLALVRSAEGPPWPDASHALLAELRVRSMSRWLPPEEAAELLAAFDRELDRLDVA